MRKLLFIPLLTIFVLLMVFGRGFANQPKYSDQEIQEYNQNLLIKQEQSMEQPIELEDGPIIQAAYPKTLKNGGTVTSDRVYLEFVSAFDIVKVTVNGRSVANLKDTTINTAGTYKVVVIDEEDNESGFSFTLNK